MGDQAKQGFHFRYGLELAGEGVDDDVGEPGRPVAAYAFSCEYASLEIEQLWGSTGTSIAPPAPQPTVVLLSRLLFTRVLSLKKRDRPYTS